MLLNSMRKINRIIKIDDLHQAGYHYSLHNLSSEPERLESKCSCSWLWSIVLDTEGHLADRISVHKENSWFFVLISKNCKNFLFSFR